MPAYHVPAPRGLRDDEVDLMMLLIQYGPIELHEIKNSYTLANLYDEGFASSVIVKTKTDFVAATYDGMRAFCVYCNNAQTVPDAIENWFKIYSAKQDAKEASDNPLPLKRTA